jgi:hydroxymethylbilane synthase
MKTPIRIGSRGSQLALWQANHIAAQLRAQGHAVEIEVIRTVGDRMQDPGVAAAEGLSPNGVGIFIKEIEESLAAGRIDLAVHSLKDLPVEIDGRFALAAIPARADARDALVCEDYWGLHMLPTGARIGTTSPRRQAMLLALRPDLEFVEMRGNIDTRLRKWSEGEAEALVLASAGLDRLGRTESVHQRFSVDEVCPAPGQGALALETRANHLNDGDASLYSAVRALNCAAAEFATQAERAVLAALGGGCQLPLGAFCHRVDERWELHCMVAAADGEGVAHYVETGSQGISPTELGQLAAQGLIARGASDLLRGEPIEAVK